METGQLYFACTSLTGVGLENGGGSGTAGSHWERSELGPEFMTGATIEEPKYSIFTMALLKDSGWYDPDFTKADQLLFGYHEGCDFINQKCNGVKKFKEFCESNSDRGCDDDGTST